MFWFRLPPATKALRGRPSVAAPPLASVRRRMKKNRQKLVGQDKGSLTEQQTEGNRNNNDTNKEKTQQ